MKRKINGFLTLLIMLIAQIALGQDLNVSGLVSDSNGLPLPGANVKVKGSAVGTQTDFDGVFKIKARTGDVLSVTFQGMNSQELKVTGSKLNFKLSGKATELESVVVTALDYYQKNFSIPEL